MPARRTGPYGPVLSRRRLLVTVGAAAVLGGVSACTGDELDTDEPNIPSATPTPPDPDADRRSGAVSTAYSLAAIYRATIAAHPALTAVLQPLLDDHLAHAVALSPEPATPSPSSSGTASASAGSTTSAPTTPGPSVPPDPTAAVAALRAAETTASGSARQDAVNAVDSALARLLASIGASRAVHAAILATAA